MAVAAAIASSAIISSTACAQASAEKNPQWNCSAENGEWVCNRDTSTHKAYQRPQTTGAVANIQTKDQSALGLRITLDWVAFNALSEKQKAACSRGCKGAYVAPSRDDDEAGMDPTQAELRAEAASTEIDALTQRATMQGDVAFTQGWREVRADRVVVNRTDANYRLEGNVTVREPGILLIGDSASLAGIDNSLQIDNATYLFHEQQIRGTAAQITRDDNSLIVIEDATYTSCEPGSSAWVMEADKLSINNETGRASGRNIVIKTGGLPVLYTPYISFSADGSRQSGLLYPSIEFGSEDGIDYRQPIYWNIADNQDVTLSPRVIEGRGAGIGVNHRYLSQSTLTESTVNYFSDDTSGDRGGLYDNTARWLLNIDHQGYINQFWTRLDIARVSDVDYFEDYGNSSFDESSDANLRQQGEISLQQGDWQFKLLAENFQNLVVENADEYQRAPELDIHGNGLWGSQFWWDLAYQFSVFDHARDDLLGATGFQQATDNTWITGERLRSDLQLGWRVASESAYIESILGVDYLYYRLDDPLAGSNNKNPSETAPNISLDMGLSFERNTSLLGTSWLQTLEPRVHYLYRDAGDQSDIPIFDTALASNSYNQLFRRSQFVGGDRLSDDNRLTFGLSSSFYDQNTGRELGKLSVAQTYHLKNREVSLNPSIRAGLTDPNALAPTSDLLIAAIVGQQALNELARDRSEVISSVDLNLSSDWQLSSEIIWDEEKSAIDRSQIDLQYENSSNNTEIRMSYFREEDAVFSRDRNNDGISALNELLQENVEQASLTGVYDWNDNWSIVGRWQYDLTNKRNIDGLVGLGYHDCCWNASITWRRSLERDDQDGFFTEAVRNESGIYLSFEWIGLGGVGEAPQELINRGRIQ